MKILHRGLPPSPLYRLTSVVGTCTSVCRRIHDPTRVAICPRRLQKMPCDHRNCRLSHAWSFHNVPSCVYFLTGFCQLHATCTFAHQDGVNVTSPWCEQFQKLGYCWLGRACRKIHHFGGVGGTSQPGNDDGSMIEDEEDASRAAVEQKLAAAKQKVKENKDRRRNYRTPDDGRLRRVSMEEWATEEEEFVPTGETGGEFSRQQDFVPL